jgi:hypothetical protein
MLEPAAAAGMHPRAFLPVGGLSVARQQLGLVLALGCERIVCLARELGPELLELQHASEAKGAQFHAISAPRALAGLVTTADELIALADGLLADPEEAIRLLEAAQAVLVQPVEAGLAAGFERLDINHASAGALRMPGHLVERLADLPTDIDAMSALTRIALQSGVAQRQITVAEASAQRWSLVRSDDEAEGIEPAWFAERMSPVQTVSPGGWLARAAAKRFGPSLLHSANGKLASLVGGGLLAALGLGAGWFGFTTAGLILCALGWITGRMASELDQIERKALLRENPRVSSDLIQGWGTDAVLVALAGWGVGAMPDSSLGQNYFAPAMVVALSRLVPRLVHSPWAQWLEDRALLAIVLAGAQVSGQVGPVTQGLALLLALAALISPRRQSG